MTIVLKTLAGDWKKIPEDVAYTLRSALSGPSPEQGQPGYDDARTLWNAMIDRKPGLVIRALDASDIQAAVNFARDNGLLMSIRAGGHQIAGHAVADGALLLDLSLMRSVSVDAIKKTARVDPGCTLSEVDQETQLYGLAVPVGINATTGISGLTLGGGFGWITRKYGLTIDSLMSAEVVTADGKLRTASASQNADLYWGIRGGGGNFGVVSSFEFALHSIGPEILSGLVIHPAADAKELLREFRLMCAESPDELTVWTVLRKAPPLPFIPAEWHGREILIFAACYAGHMKDGEKAVKKLRSLGKPIADVIGPHPYTGWQAAFDPLLAPGERNYWKSHDFLALTDDLIDEVLDAFTSLPDPQTEIVLAHLGGAMTRIAADATPFRQREAHFIMNVHTRWSDAKKDETCIDWTRQLFERTTPYATGSVYVNFMPADEVDRVAGAYGANMARLSAIKAKYDPDNLFRLNHNISVEAVIGGD